MSICAVPCCAVSYVACRVSYLVVVSDRLMTSPVGRLWLKYMLTMCCPVFLDRHPTSCMSLEIDWKRTLQHRTRSFTCLIMRIQTSDVALRSCLLFFFLFFSVIYDASRFFAADRRGE